MKDPCPNCGKDAPVTLRGVTAYCVACDHPRPVLGRKVVGRSGKAAKYTGTAAKIASAATLGVGTIIALFFILLFQVALWPTGWLGWAIGIPIGLMTMLISAVLFFGGNALSKSGDKTIDRTHRKAVRALALRHTGGITADQTADALDMELDDADALLTRMAQDPNERIDIDIRHDGTLVYFIDSNAAERFQVRAPSAIAEHSASELEEELEALEESSRRQSER